MTPFAYAEAQSKSPSRDWTGYCLVFVRSCFGISAKYPSAASAWQNASHKHPETDPNKIPRGVPMFWTGGSHGYGHIALSRGGGSCWTTDLIRPGQVNVAPIAEVHAKWGLTLVGWTEDLNGVTVYNPPTPAKAATKAPAKIEVKIVHAPAVQKALDALKDGRDNATKAGATKRASRFQQLRNHIAALFPGKKTKVTKP